MKKLILFSLLLVSLSVSAQWQAERYQQLDTLYCTDPEGDEAYFTITAGNTGYYFQIQPCTGTIQVDTTAYGSFIRSRTWNLTIGCTDPQKNITRYALKVTLKKDSSGRRLAPTIIHPL